MPNQFNIAKLFEDTWGYKPPKFDVPAAAPRKETSDLGQPLYGNDALGREHFLPVKLKGILIPFAVISINERKTIVSTAMPERGGSVHEIVSIDDYNINIKGIAISDDNNFPEGDIKQLHEIFKVNGSVELRSALTDIFLKGGDKEDSTLNDLLHQVVIREVKWPAVSGVEHARAFEIDCESDMIFTLEA